MKRILPIFIVGILVFSGLGAASITNSTNYDMEKKSVAISEPTIRETGQYATIDLKEATSSLLDVGKPVLPIVTKVFTFPFGSKINSVDVSFSKATKLVLSKEVQPAPEPVSLNAREKASGEPPRETSIYESSELYPASSYSYTIGAGLDNSRHVIILAVQCHPVRYSPAQNMIYYSKTFDITVTYEKPIAPTTFLDKYDLVVIAPEEFSESLQPLIDHKNSHGVNTTLMTVEDIYSGYEGRDKPEQIKYFIKDAIESWGIDYVLLVGDIEKLPIRTTWIFQGWHHHYWNESILSDLYYADIYDANMSFCSWDSNDNGIYGENYWNCPGVNDSVDLYADVNIGRLACANIKQVRTVVDKIIHYETDTYGKSWFKNIILCGGDTFPGYDGNEGEEKNKITEQIMSDFTPTRLWASDNTFSPQTLNQAVNKGAGFVDYSGHGFEIGVGTHPPNDNSWKYYHTYHMVGLANQYKLPIIFFDACLTARLDFNVSSLIDYLPDNFQTIAKLFNFDGSKLFPCFAWCWVEKPFGGAIATIGATRTAYGGIDMGCGYLSLHFYDAYSSSETVSQMLTKAQNDYISNLWRDYFTLEEFILLGDPSLEIGGYPPAARLKSGYYDASSSINEGLDNTAQFQYTLSNR